MTQMIQVVEVLLTTVTFSIAILVILVVVLLPVLQEVGGRGSIEVLFQVLELLDSPEQDTVVWAIGRSILIMIRYIGSHNGL